MTKRFCDSCGKEIREPSFVEIEAGTTQGMLRKPSIYMTGSNSLFIVDICWSCVLDQLKEHVEKLNE